MGSEVVPWYFLFFLCRPKGGGAHQEMVGKPTHGFFICFAHGLGHDSFLPMVFCRSSQGNYCYVLIQGYGLGFMNDLACIYICIVKLKGI